MTKRSDGEDSFGADTEGFDTQRVISRRKFLRDSALAAAGVAGIGSLSQLTTSVPRLAAALPRSAKDTIVIGWHSEADTLDPSKAWDGWFSRLFTDGLVRFEGGGGEIMPALATQWRASPDGKEWTFKIRSGVRFQDGTPMKAQDIQFSFDRWLNPKNPFYESPCGTACYFFRAVEKVTAVDDRTVRFNLKNLDPAFLPAMLTVYSAPVSPEALKRLGNRGFGVKPVATGSFKVQEWIKGTRRVLERFDDYWGRRPILRRLIVKPIPEDAIRVAQLQRGEVDFIIEVPFEFIPTIQNDPNLRLLRADAHHVWWIPLNLHQKPLTDKRVRHALNYAVNKEAIARSLLKGGVTVAAGAMMKGWAEDPSLHPYPYDPQKAKQLLAAAGYPNGFRTRFWVPESGTGMVAPKAIATVVQAQLREVGVIVEIETQEWTSYLNAYSSVGLDSGKPPFGMAEMSWNVHFPDPYLMDSVLLGDFRPPKGFNAGYYNNTEVNRLFKQAAETLDLNVRKRLYFQAQRIIYEDAPWIFMFHAQNLVATRSNIRGYEVSATPWWLDFSKTYVAS
ncbi:MAG TPA: ABC transporter substrate-binding protein [bacterium]|jgi:peptide/nickel transport system substrate-binding protein|nr:ABC transporter substrate-binding protein [bacterium]